MGKNTKVLWAIILWLATLEAFGQSISILFDKEIYTCEPTTIQVNINNNTSNELPAGELILKLPCQSRYIISSILNATEANLNNLNSPILKTGIIGAGKTLNVTIKLLLGCESLACLDNKNKFDLSASYTVAGKTTSETSLPFNVSAGFVTFTKIDFAFIPIEAGTTQTRKITFKNSKRGRLSSCTFVDKYEDVLSIKSLSSAVVSNTNNSLVLRFDSTDFKLIGNKDIYFDLDEQIVVEELVTFKNCSLDEATGLSSLSVQWGCNSSVCQVSQAYATLRLTPVLDGGDKFSINAIVSDPSCMDPTSSIQRMEIKEQAHKHTFTNIKLQIRQVDSTHIEMKSFVKPSYAEIRFDSIKVNECGDSVAKIVYVTMPDMAPSEDVFRTHAFSWKAVNCDIFLSTCDRPGTRWAFDYSYNKRCAVFKDYFRKGNGIVPAIPRSVFVSTVLIENPKFPLDNGSKPKIRANIEGKKLLADGTMDITLTFPNLLVTLPTNFNLRGKTPINVKKVIGDTTTTLTLTYMLPFDTAYIVLTVPTITDCSKFVGEGSTFTEYNTTCNLCGIGNFGTYHSIGLEATFDFGVPCSDRGKIRTCSSIGFASNCTTSDTTKTDIPIYFDYDFELGRINYGLPDNDNDGFPDVEGLINTEKIKTGEIMWNDTLKMVAKGKIVADIKGSTFKDLLISMLADRFSSSNDTNLDIMKELLFEKEGWRDLNTKLFIFDKSANRSYNVNGLKDTIQRTTIVYNLSADHLHKLNPLIPQDFEFEDGDSIYLESLILMDLDIYKAVDSLHVPSQFLKFSVFVNAYYGDTLEVFDRRASLCNCYVRSISVSGYNQSYTKTFSNVYHEKNICKGAHYRNLFQKINVGHNLITPYEVRPAARLSGIKFDATPDYAIDTLIIQYRLKNYAVTPLIVNTDQTYFEISTLPTGHEIFLNTLSDHLIIMSRRLTSDCASRAPTETVPFTIYFETTSISSLIIQDSVKGIMYSEFRLPILKQDISQKKITSFNNKVATQLQYTQDQFNSNYKHDVNGLFVRVRHSAAINSVRVYDPVTGGILPNENGIYQIGLLKNGTTRKIEFDAKSTSCGKEIIYFDYGYDCGIYTEPARTPCFMAIDSIEVTFPNSILDMDTDDTPMSVELCTEINQKMTISNAGLGTAYEINVEAELPEGLTLISGSSKIQFPSGPGTITNLPDPVLVQGNTYRWILKNGWILHQLFGLSGTNDAPKNSFNLLFKVKTSCDYTVGKSIVYRTSGQQFCQQPTNISLKVANNIKISDVTAPFSIDIKSQYQLKPNCELDTLVLQYSFGKPPSNPINVQLDYPQGYTFVNAHGNLSNLSPININNVLKWSSSTPDDSVRLQVVFVKKGIAYCTSDLFKFSTALSTTSNCVGQACDVKVLTGENITTIPARDKSIDIPLWAIEMLPDGRLKYRLRLERDFDGTTPIFIKVLVDVDKNGVISPGDVRLDSFELIMNSNTKTFELSSTVLNGNTLDLCKIIVWLQGSENCLCDDKIRVGTLKPIVNTLPIVLCSDQSKTIGLPSAVPGTFYQWNTELGLSCTQCPKASFSVSNTTQGPLFFIRILTETKTDGCAIDYIFNITVNPQPSILNGDVSACQGDTIRLISTLAQSYIWTGPNILQNSQQVMIAAPTTSSIYTVAITDINGCAGTSQINVTINSAPSGRVVYDSLYCSGVIPTLQLIVPAGVSFDWIVGKDLISDPNSLNPTVLDLAGNTKLTLQIRKGDCFENIYIPIAFRPAVNIQGLKDTVSICRNSQLEFTLSGALNYVVSPPEYVTCLDANCSRFIIKTDFITQTFTIKATDIEGCIVTQNMVVNTDNNALIEQELSICKGDTILWQGIELYAAGLYCDTILVSDCIEIRCLNLSINPIKTTAENLSICQGDTITWQGDKVYAAGIYCDTILASNCLEIRCLNLSIKPINTTSENLSICQGDSIIFNQSIIKTAGMYCDTVTSAITGCREIKCLDLTIRLPIKMEQEIVICADSSALIFGQLTNKAGTYCRTTTGVSNQCDSTLCITLKLTELPDLSDLIVNYDVEQGQTVQLQGPPGYTTYKWTPPTGLSCSNCHNPLASPSTNISYTLEVTNSLGCRTKKGININVTEICSSLFDRLPNAFTPNGDNINDLYTIPDAEFCGPKHIIVYNRWGNIVYEEPNWDNEWNGFSSNGRLLPQGTYFIILKVGDSNTSYKTMVDLRLE